MRSGDEPVFHSEEAEREHWIALDRPLDEARELQDVADRIADHGGLPFPDARCFELARRRLDLPCS